MSRVTEVQHIGHPHPVGLAVGLKARNHLVDLLGQAHHDHRRFSRHIPLRFLHPVHHPGHHGQIGILLQILFQVHGVGGLNIAQKQHQHQRNDRRLGPPAGGEQPGPPLALSLPGPAEQTVLHQQRQQIAQPVGENHQFMAGAAQGDQVHQIHAQGQQRRQYQKQKGLPRPHPQGHNADGQQCHRQPQQGLGHPARRHREGRQHLGQTLKKDGIGLFEYIFDIVPAHVDHLKGSVQRVIGIGHEGGLGELPHDFQRHIIQPAAQKQHGAAPQPPQQHRCQAFSIQQRHHTHQHQKGDAHADIALVQGQRAHDEQRAGQEAPFSLLPAVHRQHGKQQRQHIAVVIVQKCGNGGRNRQICRKNAGKHHQQHRMLHPKNPGSQEHSQTCPA